MIGQHTPLRVAFERPWPTTRRGLCLWLLGVAVSFVGGINYVLSPLSDQTRDSLHMVLRFTGGDARPWGWAMLAVGLAAIYSSYCHFGRDRIGYVLVASWCALWSAAYCTGVLVPGNGLRPLGSAAVWALMAGLTMVIAGFPNVRLGSPPPVLVRDPEGPDAGADQ